MVAIVDYGVGNLFSLRSSLSSIGADAVITGDPEKLRTCDRIILPGVGAFGDAALKLRQSSLDEVVRTEAARGKPLLGICLGMQLLFEKSYEFGEHEGLGLLKGEIVPIKGAVPEGLKVPHMGWNFLRFTIGQHPLFRHINEFDAVYFVHSYYASGCDSSVIATAEYGADLTAAVSSENIAGCQFHPEKSGSVGLSILRAFCGL